MASAAGSGAEANRAGALWMVAAATGFSLNGALVKILSASGIDVFQISLARAVFALAALSPFLWQERRTVLKTRHPWIHLMRGVAGAGAMLCGFYALSRMPLADVTALGFTQPLFTTILAVFLLGETVRWRRWTATAVGFAGVLIMMRPGSGTFEPAALVALAMALGIAFAVTLVKRFPVGESRTTMLLVFSVSAILLSLGPGIASWRPPEPTEWLLLIGVGVVGLTAQSWIIRAYQKGEASFVAPFDYSRLLIAGLLGFLLFGESPDEWTIVGALVIAAATLYIARREAALGTQKGPADH